MRTAESTPTAPHQELARFPWRLFLVFVAASLTSALLAASALGLQNVRLVFVFAQLSTSTWVYFDARQRGIPTPLRWAVGSLLLWIIIFPWYLARRRTPTRACPFVEREVGPLTRGLLFFLFFFFLLSAMLLVFFGPKK